jgi:hypothetical protein
MTLYDKILTLRPNLTQDDFAPTTGTIVLQNDSDGKGDYIREWNHPTVTQPTNTELNGVS